MEKTMIDSEKKFLEWFYKDIEKFFNVNWIIATFFIIALKNKPEIILEDIKTSLPKKIIQYQEQTGDKAFEPELSNEFCSYVIEALQKHFLTEKQAEKK